VPGIVTCSTNKFLDLGQKFFDKGCLGLYAQNLHEDEKMPVVVPRLQS
jgi:hypothetical protein